MTDMLSYPDQISIIFTDSIPCFAVIFKILSPVLPENFQYFGLWGMMCFILQGIIAARILKSYSDSRISVSHKFQIVRKTETDIIIDLSLEDSVDDIEIAITNSSDNSIKLNSIKLENKKK